MFTFKKYFNLLLIFILLLSLLFTTYSPATALASSEDLNLSFIKNGTVDVVFTTNDKDLNVSNYITDLENKLVSLGLPRNILNIIGIEGYESSKALIIQEDEAWNSQNVVEDTLRSLGYTPVVIRTSELATIDLFEYSHIFITSDQTDSFYSNLNQYMYKITDWVKGGGILQFNACDMGWRATQWVVGPAGLQHVNSNSSNNYIQIPNHTVTAGIPSTVTGNFASHGYFTNYPSNTTIYATDQTGNPTIIEFPYGKGMIFAQTTTAEFYTSNAGDYAPLLRNTINYNINKVLSRSFADILREPKWKESSIDNRYLVTVNSTRIADLDDVESTSEFITRLNKDNINFVSLGNNVNKSQAEGFIRKNDSKGAFINKDNYSNSINELATYVFNRYKASQGTSSEYFLLGQDITVNVNPSSLKKNTQTSLYPEGRWKINQDYDYFENSLGQASWVGKWQKDLVMNFDKVGKFEIQFADSYPEPRYIYIHRKPVASYNLSLSGNTLTYRNNSYDSDLQSRADKGISEYDWEWRLADSNTWNKGTISSLSGNSDYLIRLRVKDYQNTWSDYVVKYISTRADARIAPIADFDIPNTLSKYNTLNIIDNSYDPVGRAITNKDWVVLKDGNQIYKGSNPPTSFVSYGIGDYQYTLVVTNSAGFVSESYSKIIKVTDDNIKPEFIIEPNVSDWVMNNLTVKANVSDDGGSLLRNSRYIVTNSNNLPSSSDSNWKSTTSPSYNINLNNDGNYYIHFEAFDNAGNKNVRTSGPFKIDKTNPNVPSINLSNKNWAIPIVNFNISNILDATSGVSKVQYKINNGNWSDYTLGSSISIPSSLKGIIPVEARVIDNAGNISTSKVEAKIDDIKPTIKGVSIIKVNNDSQGFKVEAFDNESGLNDKGAYTYYLKLNGIDSDFKEVSVNVKNDIYNISTSPSSTLNLIKSSVIDNNNNKSDISKTLAVVSAPVVKEIKAGGDGEYDNTVTINLDNTIGKDVKVEIYRGSTLVNVITSGSQYKDKNLYYERSYEYKLIAYSTVDGNKIESLPEIVSVEIGSPTLEAKPDNSIYYITPFTDEVSITGEVAFAQGGTALIEVYDKSSKVLKNKNGTDKYLLNPQVKTSWKSIIKLSESEVNDKKRKTYRLDLDLEEFKDLGLYKKSWDINVDYKDTKISPLEDSLKNKLY